MNENTVRKAQKFKAMANKEIQISEWVIRKDLADKEFPLRWKLWTKEHKQEEIPAAWMLDVIWGCTRGTTCGATDRFILSMIYHQIFGVGTEEMQVDEINLRWTRGMRFRLVRSLWRVINLRLVWLRWYWFADCFSLFVYFLYCPRWRSTLTIYSQVTAS
jgi:hypothetical protein